MEVKERTGTEYRQILNKKFHALIKQKGIDADEKKDIVREISEGHFTSAKLLSDDQLKEAISMLENGNQVSLKKMRAKAINLARDLKLVTGYHMQINWDGLNNFCQKTFKTAFYNLSYDQLRHCITALEKWETNNTKKAINALLL